MRSCLQGERQTPALAKKTMERNAVALWYIRATHGEGRVSLPMPDRLNLWALRSGAAFALVAGRVRSLLVLTTRGFRV